MSVKIMEFFFTCQMYADICFFTDKHIIYKTRKCRKIAPTTRDTKHSPLTGVWKTSSCVLRILSAVSYIWWPNIGAGGIFLQVFSMKNGPVDHSYGKKTRIGPVGHNWLG